MEGDTPDTNDLAHLAAEAIRLREKGGSAAKPGLQEWKGIAGVLVVVLCASVFGTWRYWRGMESTAVPPPAKVADAGNVVANSTVATSKRGEEVSEPSLPVIVGVHTQDEHPIPVVVAGESVRASNAAPVTIVATPGPVSSVNASSAPPIMVAAVSSELPPETAGNRSGQSSIQAGGTAAPAATGNEAVTAPIVIVPQSVVTSSVVVAQASGTVTTVPPETKPAPAVGKPEPPPPSKPTTESFKTALASGKWDLVKEQLAYWEGKTDPIPENVKAAVLAWIEVWRTASGDTNLAGRALVESDALRGVGAMVGVTIPPMRIDGTGDNAATLYCRLRAERQGEDIKGLAAFVAAEEAESAALGKDLKEQLAALCAFLETSESSSPAIVRICDQLAVSRNKCAELKQWLESRGVAPGPLEARDFAVDAVKGANEAADAVWEGFVPLLEPLAQQIACTRNRAQVDDDAIVLLDRISKLNWDLGLGRTQAKDIRQWRSPGTAVMMRDLLGNVNELTRLMKKSRSGNR